MRHSDAANSHQPPLPSLDLQLIANDVLWHAARDPTPRLLGVRMAVKEDLARPQFRVRPAHPNALVRNAAVMGTGPSSATAAPGDNPRRRRCPAPPARPGWRARPRDHPPGRLAANAPPIRDTRAAGRANRMPPNCRTHTLPRPDPSYSVPARPRCHPTPEPATRREPQRQPALASTGRPGREHRIRSPRSSSFLQLTARERVHHPGPGQHGANHVSEG